MAANISFYCHRSLKPIKLILSNSRTAVTFVVVNKIKYDYLKNPVIKVTSYAKINAIRNSKGQEVRSLV